MRRSAAMLLLAVACSEGPVAPPPPTHKVLEPVPLPSVPAPSVARLVVAEGTVKVERAGITNAAAPGPLFEDDVVATGPASRAVLADSQGRELELGEDTRFKVGQRLTSLEVLAGDISFSGDDGGGWSDVSVRTPYGIATLKDGARGRLRFVDGGVSADVAFGTIEFDVIDGGVKTAKAGESFDVSFGSMEFEAPPVPGEVSPTTLVVESGKPQVKRPGEKRFGPAKPKEALPPGTSIQTPAGSTARLEAPHVRVSLPASTSGITEGVRTEGGQPTLTLSKVVGPLTMHFDGSGGAAVDLGDVKVAGGAESSVAVTQAGKKRRIEARAGQVSVTVKGKATTLEPGDAVVVDGNGAVSAPETKPGLVVNATPRVRVHLDSLSQLGLALPAETNRLQVARDSDFSSLVLQGQVGRQATLPVTGRAPLYYRVLDAQNQPTRQGRIDFLPDAASARDTATRTDTVSETGQKATVFYQSKVPALTFNFTAQPDVKSWRFRLYRAEALGTAVVDRKAQEPKLVLEPGVLEEGEFLWSATALDGSGNEKAGTRMNKLSVVYDNARTSLLIERPLNGERAGGEAKGVAPRAAQVFVNGKLVKPDDAGRFSVKLGTADTATFRVVVGDTESYWVRRLKR